MYLGIEIGGTKLQLGIGTGDGSPPSELVRRDVEPARGAEGIRQQICESARDLLSRHSVSRVGIGFGGPVDAAAGRVTTSHQIVGWTGFPLGDWCREQLDLELVLANDCDAAALAEARFGAGQGRSIVFYVTVGTGIGGGLVVSGQLYGTGRPASAEIGHLRPGLDADDPHATIESVASGWGIAAQARRALVEAASDDSPAATEFLADCGGNPSQITSRHVAESAAAGNPLAAGVLTHACRTLGWGIAQMITLLAPEVVVVGGGVSLVGEELFFAPLREEVARYVFPPLVDSYQVVPAQLGELVVVHGALTLAAGG